MWFAAVILLMDVLLVSSLFQLLWMRHPPVPLAPQNHRQDSVAPHRYQQCLTSPLHWTITFITTFYMQDPPRMDFHLTIILMHSTQLLLRSPVMPEGRWMHDVTMWKWVISEVLKVDVMSQIKKTPQITLTTLVMTKTFCFLHCRFNYRPRFLDLNKSSGSKQIICLVDHLQ